MEKDENDVENDEMLLKLVKVRDKKKSSIPKSEIVNTILSAICGTWNIIYPKLIDPDNDLIDDVSKQWIDIIGPALAFFITAICSLKIGMAAKAKHESENDTFETKSSNSNDRTIINDNRKIYIDKTNNIDSISLNDPNGSITRNCICSRYENVEESCSNSYFEISTDKPKIVRESFISQNEYSNNESDRNDNKPQNPLILNISKLRNVSVSEDVNYSPLSQYNQISCDFDEK